MATSLPLDGHGVPVHHGARDSCKSKVKVSTIFDLRDRDKTLSKSRQPRQRNRRRNRCGSFLCSGLCAFFECTLSLPILPSLQPTRTAVKARQLLHLPRPATREGGGQCCSIPSLLRSRGEIHHWSNVHLRQLSSNFTIPTGVHFHKKCPLIQNCHEQQDGVCAASKPDPERMSRSGTKEHEQE